MRDGDTNRFRGSMGALRLFIVLAYAFNMLVNYLGNLGYFGETNAEVSAKYPTLLTPAGYAFAIWGVIFSLQGIYAVYGVLPVDEDKLRYYAILGVYVPLGWIGEAIWTPIFNQELIPYTPFFITGSCLFFLAAYLRVTEPDNSPFAGESSVLKKAFYYAIFVLPTALNFGWLVVASIVNVLIDLKYYQVEVTPAAAIGCLVFANAIAVFFLAWRREVVVALVQVWAITAISVNQVDATLKSACYASVGLLSVLVLGTLVFSIASSLRQGKRPSPDYHNIESGYQLTDVYYGARH